MSEFYGGLETIDFQTNDQDAEIGALAKITLQAVDKRGGLCYNQSARIITRLLQLKQEGQEAIKAISYRIWYIKGHGVAMVVTENRLFFIDTVGCSTYNMRPGIQAFRIGDWDFDYGNPRYSQAISEDLVLGSERLNHGRPNNQEIPIRSFQDVFDIARRDLAARASVMPPVKYPC